MAAYKDEQRGSWYVSFHYNDWTGKNCRKVKRGFKTRKEALEWENHFRMKEGSDLDMTFAEFVEAYTRDMKPKPCTFPCAVNVFSISGMACYAHFHGTKLIYKSFRYSDIFQSIYF